MKSPCQRAVAVERDPSGGARVGFDDLERNVVAIRGGEVEPHPGISGERLEQSVKGQVSHAAEFRQRRFRSSEWEGLQCGPGGADSRERNVDS